MAVAFQHVVAYIQDYRTTSRRTINVELEEIRLSLRSELFG